MSNYSGPDDWTIFHIADDRDKTYSLKNSGTSRSSGCTGKGKVTGSGGHTGSGSGSGSSGSGGNGSVGTDGKSNRTPSKLSKTQASSKATSSTN